MISVLIADKNYLSRLGLYTLLSTSPNFEVDYTEDENFENLVSCIQKNKPKILVLDFQSLNINSKQISTLTKTFKRLQKIFHVLPVSQIQIYSRLCRNDRAGAACFLPEPDQRLQGIFYILQIQLTEFPGE